MFEHPFTCIVAGPTKAGKTSFVKQLIKNKNLIQPEPIVIWYAYTENQPAYDELKDSSVNFVEGIPDLNVIKQYQHQNQLLILDDLMQNLKNNQSLVELFTRGCHHWNVSVIHIVQNLFFEGLRTSRINSQYVVLMKNPSDQLQLHTLARQLFPAKSKYFLEAYKDATSIPHGYLLVDLTQKTQDHLRLRTDIFSKTPIVYTPKV